MCEPWQQLAGPPEGGSPSTGRSALRGFLSSWNGVGTPCEERRDNLRRVLSQRWPQGTPRLHRPAVCPAPSFQEGPVGALTWPRCQGSSWKCLGTSFGHPTHPIFLTWEVTLGLGHDGDARLGSGFKVAAETSGSGMEAGGEAVVCPADPGRGGGRWGIYRHCRSGNMGWGWMWPPPLEPLPHAMNSGHPNPSPSQNHPRAVARTRTSGR